MAIPNDENTASRIQTIHEVRITAMRATLKQLGIEVEEKILAKLVEGYDGVMPMERYLAENGYWVPLAPADGREGEGFGDGSA
ncbi:hypothetical protein MMC18_004472 [Xylographa bjoerkii]|nr:hypothetical protein [Xylographa bjoerkii]